MGIKLNHLFSLAILNFASCPSQCQHLERTTRGKSQGASGARARGAVWQSRFVGSAGHRLIDLLLGGKVASVLCVVTS